MNLPRMDHTLSTQSLLRRMFADSSFARKTKVQTSEKQSDLVYLQTLSKGTLTMKTLLIDDAHDLPLTVIIPVYNEAVTVVHLLERVLAVSYPKQVILVDDGSTDGTSELLQQWADHPDVVLLRHSHNRGKGAAIRTGLAHARGRFTLVQDADLEYDPRDYPRLLEPLLHGRADIVYGSRYLRPSSGSRACGRLFRYGVALLNLAVWLLYGVRLTDEATCYKVFPTEVLQAMDLQCERFEFCPEVTAKACRMGLTIAEVPIHYTPRSAAEGKKIRLTDGWEALVTLWKWRHWAPSATTYVKSGKEARCLHAF
jgi:dolichol-phosphate mannosyltransferase